MFAGRGMKRLGEPMLSVFLYHAVRSGLTMAIVNAGQLAMYDELPEKLGGAVEDVILNRTSGATEQLLHLAPQYADNKTTSTSMVDQDWRGLPITDRLTHSLVSGVATYVLEDVEAARLAAEKPLAVIEGSLLDGVNRVGDLCGARHMVLTRVVNSSRALKKALHSMVPFTELE